VYVMIIVPPFEGLPIAFADCAPTAAVTDMATAVVSIQIAFIFSFSSFEQAERACVMT
jgi:hypothetical protein